jgi:hypothetical protein
MVAWEWRREAGKRGGKGTEAEREGKEHKRFILGR